MELHLDSRCTILLGANDHGKSNLLEAMRHLNDDVPFTGADLNWDCEDQFEELPLISFVFELTATELDSLARLGLISRRLLKAEEIAADLVRTDAQLSESEAAGEAANAETMSAEEIVEALRTQLDSYRAEHGNAETANDAEQLARVAAQISDLETRLETAQQSATVKRAQSDAHDAEVSSQRADAESTRERFEASPAAIAQRQVDACTARAAKAQSDVERAAGELKTARAASEANSDDEASTQALNTAESEHSQRSSRLEAALEDLDGARQALQDAVSLDQPSPDADEQIDPSFEDEDAPRIPPVLVLERRGLQGSLLTRSDFPIPHDDLVAFLEEHKPRVELITPVSNIPDSASENNLNDTAHEFMRGIFHYAGLDTTTWSALFNRTDRTLMRLEEASTILNEQLSASWVQGSELGFRLDHNSEAGEVDLLLKDPAVKERYVRASQRSNGFTHFFALKTILHARQADVSVSAGSYIWLFDEPGIFLHPDGQRDLLKVIETLSVNSQCVYTTHSIFLLNKNYPSRHRLVIKDDRGTVLDGKPFVGRWRAAIDALGFGLPASILFAPNVLIVEGDSDAIYLNYLLQWLAERGDITFDLNQLAIIGSGDAVEAKSLIRMLGEGAGRPQLAVLCDGDQGGTDRMAQLADLLTERAIPSWQLKPGTTTEDHLIAVDKVWLPAAATYTARVADDEYENVATELENRFLEHFKSSLKKKAFEGVSAWLSTAAEEVAGLEQGPSKNGIAREYVLDLGEYSESPSKTEMKRALDLATRIEETFSLPSITYAEGEILQDLRG